MLSSDEEGASLPLYIRVHADLVRRIAMQEWRPGSALPAELKLATAYNVSIGTMRRAIQALAEQGCVKRRQGSGTFIRRAHQANSLGGRRQTGLMLSSEEDASVPLYIRVCADLARRISMQEWRPGLALPAELALATAYNVSIGTMRHAIQVLVDQGRLIRRPGSGTFIRGGHRANSVDGCRQLIAGPASLGQEK